MTAEISPTRRRFLKGGALVVAPFAAAIPVVAHANEAAAHARIEDERALARLGRTLLARINAGDHAGAAELFAHPHAFALEDELEALHPAPEADLAEPTFAEDGRATAALPCAAIYATPLMADCTFAQMAQAQGSGITRHEAPRMLSLEYVRLKEGWRIARMDISPADSAESG